MESAEHPPTSASPELEIVTFCSSVSAVLDTGDVVQVDEVCPGDSRYTGASFSSELVNRRRVWAEEESELRNCSYPPSCGLLSLPSFAAASSGKDSVDCRKCGQNLRLETGYVQREHVWSVHMRCRPPNALQDQCLRIRANCFSLNSGPIVCSLCKSFRTYFWWASRAWAWAV